MTKDIELEIFAPHCDFITWTGKQEIYDALRIHYLMGRTETEQEFSDKCQDTWKKKRSLKLIDGTTLGSIDQRGPYDCWMSKNTEIIIKALSPDTWSTDHEENDMPDFMKIPRVGLFHEGTPEEYMEGKREHRIAKVSKQFGLRSVIRSYDTGPEL